MYLRRPISAATISQHSTQSKQMRHTRYRYSRIDTDWRQQWRKPIKPRAVALWKGAHRNRHQKLQKSIPNRRLHRRAAMRCDAYNNYQRAADTKRWIRVTRAGMNNSHLTMHNTILWYCIIIRNCSVIQVLVTTFISIIMVLKVLFETSRYSKAIDDCLGYWTIIEV